MRPNTALSVPVATFRFQTQWLFDWDTSSYFTEFTGNVHKQTPGLERKSRRFRSRWNEKTSRTCVGRCSWRTHRDRWQLPCWGHTLSSRRVLGISNILLTSRTNLCCHCCLCPRFTCQSDVEIRQRIPSNTASRGSQTQSERKSQRTVGLGTIAPLETRSVLRTWRLVGKGNHDKGQRNGAKVVFSRNDAGSSGQPPANKINKQKDPHTDPTLLPKSNSEWTTDPIVKHMTTNPLEGHRRHLRQPGSVTSFQLWHRGRVRERKTPPCRSAPVQPKPSVLGEIAPTEGKVKPQIGRKYWRKTLIKAWNLNIKRTLKTQW